MARLTWTIETTAGTVAQDGPTISDANMDRFLDWLNVLFPQLDVNGNPLPRTPARDAQSFRDWVTVQEWPDTRDTVLRWEDEIAHQAVAAPEPIDP